MDPSDSAPVASDPPHDALRAALRAELAHATRTLRATARRLAPLALAAILVALVPLVSLAANPFGDLNPGSVHNANIEAIYNAGITKGCDPGVAYCPNRTVTREEMASFLARTAGLGDNPPVANAATLGGRPASAFLPASGDLTLRYTFLSANLAATSASKATIERVNSAVTIVQASVTGEIFIYLSLDRPTVLFAQALGLKGVQVCFAAQSGARITATQVNYYDVAARATKTALGDATIRPAAPGAATPGCYDVPVATPVAVDAPLMLRLAAQFDNTSALLSLYSATLTLAPTATPAAGAAGTATPAGPDSRP